MFPFNIDSDEAVVPHSYRKFSFTCWHCHVAPSIRAVERIHSTLLSFLQWLPGHVARQDKLVHTHRERTGASGSAEPHHVASGRNVVVTRCHTVSLKQTVLERGADSYAIFTTLPVALPFRHQVFGNDKLIEELNLCLGQQTPVLYYAFDACDACKL